MGFGAMNTGFIPIWLLFAGTVLLVDVTTPP
jgi:hypothetical protein